MATIHPSRLNLIPRDYRDSYSSRGLNPSPPSTSYRDSNSRNDERNRSRRTSRSRSRSPRSKAPAPRRPSPEYSEYRRPRSRSPFHEENQAPRRKDDRAHHNRRNLHSSGGGGPDFLENRRIQRESGSANVWPPSPKAPTRDLSPEVAHKRHRHSKRRRSSSSDSTDSSSEDERRRRDQNKKRTRKMNSEEESRKKSRSRYNSDDGEEEENRRKDRSSQRSSSRRAKSIEKFPLRSPSSDDDEIEWVEKTNRKGLIAPPPALSMPGKEPDYSTWNQSDEGSDVEVGPLPAVAIGKSTKRTDERQYGGALLRGEGSAMAAFLQEDTSVRIPRRGEIGMTSEEIATFEEVGYVMSGSRHKRMNAVRIRKENQVISAEERRGILKLQKEEKERREAILREEFQDLVSEKLKSAPPGPLAK